MGNNIREERTVKEDVYATLLLNDAYLPGALVLAHSIRKHGTDYKLACLITPLTVSECTITILKKFYDFIIQIDTITNPDLSRLAVMNRTDLASTFTKLELWNQTQFRRILYLDADVLPLASLDALFTLSLPAGVTFAAAPELGMPDCFNSGVMLLSPCTTTYCELSDLAAQGRSFDGGDQGLLNEYWGEKTGGWKRLSFGYNVELNAVYRLYMPAIRRYWANMRCVHFIGRYKPWDFEEGRVGEQDGSAYQELYGEMVGRWWVVWREVRSELEVRLDWKNVESVEVKEVEVEVEVEAEGLVV